MTPLSVDTRRRIVEAYNDGEGTYEEIAERFKCGRATVDRVLRLDRENGSLAPKPNRGRKPILDDVDMESIHLLVLTERDLTLERLSVRFVEEGGRAVSISTLHRALVKLGFTRKKSPLKPRSGSVRT